MLTVRDALKTPIFERAALIAGANGQDHIIRWVHIIDLPHPTFDWGKGGELLLTSGVGWHDELDAQQALVPRLVSKGLSGMVLSLGRKDPKNWVSC